MQYDLSIDQQLKKSYRFPINKTQILWIGLMPFVWINTLTVTQTQAFEATVHQFLRASQADGLLSTPPSEGR
ncbi:MAG: hypothetical protein HY348_00960 [Nitrospira defluvii]|nr:hypothetical protein [Nitrospira defluvii]